MAYRKTGNRYSVEDFKNAIKQYIGGWRSFNGYTTHKDAAVLGTLYVMLALFMYLITMVIALTIDHVPYTMTRGYRGRSHMNIDWGYVREYANVTKAFIVIFILLFIFTLIPFPAFLVRRCRDAGVSWIVETILLFGLVVSVTKGSYFLSILLFIVAIFILGWPTSIKVRNLKARIADSEENLREFEMRNSSSANSKYKVLDDYDDLTFDEPPKDYYVPGTMNDIINQSKIKDDSNYTYSNTAYGQAYKSSESYEKRQQLEKLNEMKGDMMATAMASLYMNNQNQTPDRDSSLEDRIRADYGGSNGKISTSGRNLFVDSSDNDKMNK